MIDIQIFFSLISFLGGCAVHYSDPFSGFVPVPYPTNSNHTLGCIYLTVFIAFTTLTGERLWVQYFSLDGIKNTRPWIGFLLLPEQSSLAEKSVLVLVVWSLFSSGNCLSFFFFQRSLSDLLRSILKVNFSWAPFWAGLTGLPSVPILKIILNKSLSYY